MRHSAAIQTMPTDPAPSVVARTLQHVSEHALDATVMMSIVGRITGWNARAEALFGWSASEVVGRPLVNVIVPPRFRRQHRAGLARYRLTGQGHVLDRPLDVTAQRRNGSEFAAQLSITALDEGNGVVFVGFIRDVSATQAMETALRDSETQFRSLVEQLPGIAYVDELGGRGRYVSPQVEPILGCTVEEWLADPELWARMLHDEDRARALAQLAAGEAAGGSFTYLYRLIARDGRTVWIRDQATVLREENGRSRAVHGVMFDVTREIGTQAEMELDLAERQRISEALRRLPAGRPAQETAAAICRELTKLAHVDMAVVYEFAHDGSVIPLGQVVPSEGPTTIGEPIPPDRAAYLRESSTGPWIDEWRPQADDTPYQRSWHRLGLKVAAYVPFGNGETTHGLLAIGSTHPIGSAEAARWMPSVADIAAVAAALLVPELGSRRAQDTTRSQLARIISNGEFHPVFQPIVRLGDGTVVGFEALTRFADGVPPERRFALAEAVDMGAELEAATMRAALLAAADLPARAWVSVNVSPTRLADPRLLRLAAVAKRRPLVLEITERQPIEDYAAARDALDKVIGSVDVAVDDAGAGFSSLRHIIELRPRYVKLDLHLVRGVEGDPARQALIAGMVYFARDTGCLLIAEGVEKAAERDTLRRLGVPFGQGYLFGRPAPASAWSAAPASGVRPAGRRKAAESID
jgi:PAS domain S-box-containing protein